MSKTLSTIPAPKQKSAPTDSATRILDQWHDSTTQPTTKNDPQANNNPSPHPKSGGLPSYCSTLYSICQEENIDFQLLSLNWIKRLEKSHQVRYIMGYKFDLNSYASGNIADDKFATYCALHYANIPAVEHFILYDFTNQANYAYGHNSFTNLERYFHDHADHIVIKPCNGTGGHQVYQLTDLQKVAPILTEIFYNNSSACLCPFYKIKHEYRVILLDHEVRLAYMKTLRNTSSDWKFNLQQGALSEPIPAEIYDKVINLALRAIQEINLRFCSVDIIQTQNDELLVLELNSGVMIQNYVQQHPDQYETVKAIYRDAILRMFEE